MAGFTDSTYTSTSTDSTCIYSCTYTFTASHHRPIGGCVIATREEADAWVAAFEAEVGALSKKQRKELAARIYGFPIR